VTRMRRLVVVLVAMLVAGFALLLLLENLGPRAPRSDGVAPHSVLALELAPDASAFDDRLRRFWIAPRPAPALTEAGTPEAPIPRLRWSLVVDSLLLVPAYTGLWSPASSSSCAGCARRGPAASSRGCMR
jgi:hypothetical protein